MNVNDVICVGAEPLAMLDYIAIERADPDVCEQIGVGLARGAELAGVEIPGGELAQLGDMVRGFDVAGACFGTVALDAIVDGSAVRPGDAIVGLPSSGIHSNGYTLARAALEGLPLDEDPEGRLGRPLGDVAARADRDLRQAGAGAAALRGRRARARPHHLGRDGQPAGLAADVAYEIDAPLPVPPIFALIQERGGVADAEMSEVFNMGCGFCCVVAAERRGGRGRDDAAPLSGGRAAIGRTVEGSSVRLK